MTLSTSIPALKRKARLLARQAAIPLHQALDRVAASEGFRGWSLFAARAAEGGIARAFHARLDPGDMVLLAARPGQGKTLMGLRLALEAIRAGGRAAFFTLEYTARDVAERLPLLDDGDAGTGSALMFDTSEAISADHVAGRLAGAPRGTLAVVDYMQILDQDRAKPALAEQMRTLRGFANDTGAIVVVISQIDRSYDPAQEPFPDFADVRLPNPLDLSVFDKACFLNAGKARFRERWAPAP